MISLHMTGRSKDSKAAALSAALKHAVSASKGSAHAHLILRDIIETENGYLAELDLEAEPRARSRALKNEGPRPDPARDIKAQEQREKRLQREEERHHEEMLRHDMETQAQEARYREEMAEFLVVYLEFQYEPAFRAVKDQFEFDRVHIMEPGTNWRELSKHRPDMDFYRAEHRPEPAPKETADEPNDLDLEYDLEEDAPREELE